MDAFINPSEIPAEAWVTVLGYGAITCFAVAAIAACLGFDALLDLMGWKRRESDDLTLRRKSSGRKWVYIAVVMSFGLTAGLLVACGVALANHAWYFVMLAFAMGVFWTLFLSEQTLKWIRARPVRWLCANKECGRALDSHTQWDCGFCGKRNERRIFLAECKHCENAPSAYECPWPGCHAIHHLMANADEQHRAKLIPAAPPQQSEAEKTAQFERESKDRNRKMAELRESATLAELELHLARLEKGKPDDKARFEEWRRQQADDLLHRVTTLKESYEEEERMIVGIKSDPKYGASQTQLINQIRSMYQTHRSKLPNPRLDLD